MDPARRLSGTMKPTRSRRDVITATPCFVRVSAALVALGMLLAPDASLAEHVFVTVVSGGWEGTEANNASGLASMTDDARFVAFASNASNLVSNDTNGATDIFLRDRALGTNTLISLSDGGEQANAGSLWSSISGDGRYVAFLSGASNLVTSDGNRWEDVFVRDVIQSSTERVSVTGNGLEQNGPAKARPVISQGGRFVAFSSLADNLVPGDTNHAEDIFVRDRLEDTTVLASIGLTGPSDGYSTGPSISADGRFIAFESIASNLVPGDTNGSPDIFVRDMVAGTTIRASVSATGTQAIGYSLRPEISRDGTATAFESNAVLVPADQNRRIDVYVRSLIQNTTTLVSMNSNGDVGNDQSDNPALSRDGRVVAFRSMASNLIPVDLQPAIFVGPVADPGFDLFVRDVATGRTTLVSADEDGGQGNGWSFDPVVSANGKLIVFSSAATNLVPRDSNEVTDVFVRDRGTPTCSGGTREEGLASARLHHLESTLHEKGDAIHKISCELGRRGL